MGGLSVLREIRAVLPDADLTYVADRGRAPYGVKTLHEVEAISLDVAGWLVDRGADCLVVACNTASAAALETIRARYPDLPVVGMEPAVKPAALASQTGKVAVFATAATFQGKLFESVVNRFATGVEVITRACPEWVALVERGTIDGAEAEGLVMPVVSDMADQGADVIVLACTHFSFLKPLIERVGGIDVVDPAPAVAAQTARVAPGPEGTATLVLAASGDVDEFARLSSALARIDGPVIRFPA